jgi:glycosyltransferase involved in cell wall biosynthesis
MKEPLVSILIPCYNCATWVSKAIESALNQTWPRKEIILIDDGSKDESWQVINSFVPAIHAEHQLNQGPTKTRNRLLSLARGDWIQFLDADDELAANKIEIQLQHSAEADAIFGSMSLDRYEGQRMIGQSKQIAQNGTDKWAKWFRWEYPNPSAFLFRAQVLHKISGWDTDYQLCEDFALYRDLLFAGARFVAAPEAWSNYRQWSANQLINKYSNELADNRFRLMLDTAKRLEDKALSTKDSSNAFRLYAFQSIRNLYSISPRMGTHAMSDLERNFGKFTPPASCVPLIYRMLYHSVGFAAAENVARWRRLIAPSRMFWKNTLAS